MANTSKILIVSFFLLLMAPVQILGQSKSDKTVVGKVGGDNITYAELKKNYSSGNVAEVSLEELESFLPIYLDYKAKLKAARDLGYYSDSTLVQEHQNYVKQAAYAWWLENEIKPSAFNLYKERASVELKPYHILIALDENSTEEQIEEAKKQLEAASNEIEQGVPLSEVDEKYSTRRGGRSMGGDIPWISAGRTVKPFEDAIYDLEVGEISEPFRTQFGYHVALLQDKRERTPARLTSHIYVRGDDSTSYSKIEAAYKSLESGTEWSNVVREFSEDGASIRNNGRIGWVSYQSNFAMEFVDTIINQDPEQEYTEPVSTNYGYHIFKIDSVQSFATEADRDQALLKELQDSPYYEENNQFVLNYLNNNFGSAGNTEALQKYEAWLVGQDTTRISSLSFPSSISNETIYTLGTASFSLRDFHNYLTNRYDQSLANRYSEEWFSNFKDYVADDKIVELTLERYPSFEEQSENYLNGLVVYNINEDNVWSSASVDSSRLRKMYEDNIQNYQYEDRPFYYLLTARHDSTLEKAEAFINNGGSPDSLRSNIKNLGVSSDSTSEYSEPPFDRLMGMDSKSFSEIFEYNNRKAIFWLQEVLPARTMSFDEAFNRIMSEFQPQREKEWLEDLRSTYKVKSNLKKLRKAYQQDS